MTKVTDALAGIIRQVDGDNTLSPTDLGEAVAMKLPPFYQTLRGRDLIAFVERTNPDKRMAAARILFLREELTAVRDLAFRGAGSPADALEAILARANRALEAQVTR